MTLHLLRQLNAVVAGSEPAKPRCHVCRGLGESKETGRVCMWCHPMPPDDPADEARELAAVKRAEAEYRRGRR